MTPLLGMMASGATGSKQSSYESIATVTAAGGEASLTFSSIPGTYKHLQIRGWNKAASTSGSYVNAEMTFNSDTGNNYTYHLLRAGGTSVSSSGGLNTGGSKPNLLGYANDPAYTNAVGVSIVDIIDYASTSKYKTVRTITALNNDSTLTLLDLYSNLWLNTNAITTITITQQGGYSGFFAGATFALYGIKG
jgi:hypothetical protein